MVAAAADRKCPFPYHLDDAQGSSNERNVNLTSIGAKTSVFKGIVIPKNARLLCPLCLAEPTTQTVILRLLWLGESIGRTGKDSCSGGGWLS